MTALRASPPHLALGFLAALGLALHACTPQPALAAPLAVGSEDWEVMEPYADWIRTLQHQGVICCTMADGRPVEARTRGDRWQVRWRPGQLAGAPTEWTDVPPDVVMQGHNLIGLAIAFWLGGVIRCFVPPVSY